MVLDGHTINLADVQNPAAAMRHASSVDTRLGYDSRSMLTVPMHSARGDVIGVVQLINKKRRPGARLVTVDDFDALVAPFGAEDEALTSALAASAGVILENALLYSEIRDIFEGFVRASVHAIEQRDPTTSGHSQRVATLTVGLASAADRARVGPYTELRIGDEEMRRIEWAALLHDFGKVGVPENVLLKAKKLYGAELELIRQRFDLARLGLEVEMLRGRLAPDAYEAASRRLVDDFAVVLVANEPTVLEEGSFARLREIAARTWRDASGRERPLLAEEEVAALSVRRGSLNAAERRAIESHVVHTRAFLARIPWGRELRGITELAGAHHEKLDGSGYPLGLRADAIAPPVRMMTICDIFDALVATDRPYKKAMPVERALGILGEEAAHGKLDVELLRIFTEAEVYRRTVP